MPPLRVLIADEHQLFAETLGQSLDFDERVEVAGLRVSVPYLAAPGSAEAAVAV